MTKKETVSSRYHKNSLNLGRYLAANLPLLTDYKIYSLVFYFYSRLYLKKQFSI